MDGNKQTIRENIVLSARTNFMLEAIAAALPIMQFIKDNKKDIFKACNEEVKEKIEEYLIIFFVMLEKIQEKEVKNES